MDELLQQCIELRRKIGALFNEQEYKQVTELFSQVLDESDVPESAKKAIYPIWALNIISLSMIGGDDHTELKKLEDTCADKLEFLAINCQLFISMKFFKYIELLRPTSRVALTSKMTAYEMLGQFDKWDEANTAFEKLPPHEIEHQIIFINEGVKSVFQGAMIKSFKINNSLPNDNIYVEFEVENDSSVIKATIPGPSNDGICDEGSIELKTEQSRIVNITREQVMLEAEFSPYGLSVRTGAITIKVMNTHLLCI